MEGVTRVFLLMLAASYVGAIDDSWSTKTEQLDPTNTPCAIVSLGKQKGDYFLNVSVSATNGQGPNLLFYVGKSADCQASSPGGGCSGRTMGDYELTDYCTSTSFGGYESTVYSWDSDSSDDVWTGSLYDCSGYDALLFLRYDTYTTGHEATEVTINYHSANQVDSICDIFDDAATGLTTILIVVIVVAVLSVLGCITCCCFCIPGCPGHKCCNNKGADPASVPLQGHQGYQGYQGYTQPGV